jgi:hypothetical protein
MRVNHALHVAAFAVLLLSILVATRWQVLVVESMKSLRSLARLSLSTGRLSHPSVAPSIFHRNSNHPSERSHISTQTQSSKRHYATVMSSINRVTDALEKPDLDDRSYRVVTLPNKLEALLVHDPETDKASASLNVNIGNFADDEDMPGMAHAVEHLLFMGTKKVCTFTPKLRILLTDNSIQ